MKFLFTNFGSTTLATAADTTSAILTVLLGQGSLFPEPDESAGERFSLVLRKPDGTPEVVHCWKRDGDNLHVLRAREGTTAQDWEQGSAISLRTTAEALNDWASVQANAFVVAENHYFEIESVTVAAEHVFEDGTARDAYFADPENVAELVDGVAVQVGDIFQVYDEPGTAWNEVLPRDNYFTVNPDELMNGMSIWLADELQVYDSANAVWRNVTAYIEGPPGPMGDVTQDVVNAKDAALGEIAALGGGIVTQAETARDQAEVYANTVLETNALAYDPMATYSFPQVVVGSDGHTYRCMGTDITGEDPVTT